MWADRPVGMVRQDNSMPQSTSTARLGPAVTSTISEHQMISQRSDSFTDLSLAGGSGADIAGTFKSIGGRSGVDMPIPKLPAVPGVRSSGFGDRGEAKKSDWQGKFVDRRG